MAGEINVIDFNSGNERYVNAILYGRKNEEVLDLLKEEVKYANRIATALGDCGEEYLRTVKDTFDFYNSDESLELIDSYRREYEAMTRKNIRRAEDRDNGIRYINYVPSRDISNLVYADRETKRFALSQPRLFRKFLNKEVEGFIDIDGVDEVEQVPEHRLDYMRVNDGILHQTDEGFEVTYYSYEDDIEEMDIVDQCLHTHMHYAIELALDLGIDPTRTHSREESLEIQRKMSGKY